MAAVDGGEIAGVEAAMAEALRNMPEGKALPAGTWQAAHRDSVAWWQAVLPLVLYLCTDDADMLDDRGQERRPEKPRPQKLKSGTRIVPAAAPSGWVIGSRIGGAIRRYRDSESQGGTHAGPRPHVRRAHWHHFWTGPRTGTRRLVLHWLPPIPVGIAGGELPVTVHPVQG